MRRFCSLIICLCLLLCLLPTAAMAADNSRSYDFDLSIESQYQVRASTEQILTVTLVLNRTDSSEPSTMYGMQAEILYDDAFHQLVENSVMTAPGVEWTDMARRTGGRAFYLNFVSFSGGETWESRVVVGSFQLKVIADAGVSQIVPENCIVSTKDGKGAFASKSNDVTVIVSTACTVAFETNGGSEIPSQTVQYGEKVKRPEDPQRDGYHLEGWYSDLDCTTRWDFDRDTVKGNMTLYAKWAEGAAPAAPNSQNTGGWILPLVIILLILLLLLLLILLLFGKKKVTFEANGGTPLKPMYVKKGSVIDNPIVPVKPGAVFLGWYREPEFIRPWHFGTSKVNKNITLYAKWK